MKIKDQLEAAAKKKEIIMCLILNESGSKEKNAERIIAY